MNVGDLEKMLKKYPKDLQVFLRCCVNPCGNIVEVKVVMEDTYGFFGKSIDCIIMEPDIDNQFIAKRR